MDKDVNEAILKTVIKYKKLCIDFEHVSEEMELLKSEPIAIIGMGCRFPGGANNTDAYWNFLSKGSDAIKEVPKSRWSIDDYYEPDSKAPGKMITKFGGFLDGDISQFDASFFGISPKEAEYLDPQQRLLLEVSYEALESAGIAQSTLERSLTGVFIGICTRDYIDLLTATNDKDLISPYLATGNMFSTAAGRLSFIYGFQGPNFAVDTACSSSLVAIDQACESLRNRESNLALAGGVNLILCPDLSINFSKAGMLAPDGHCKTFDASADGYARGEGCGIVVLKRLSDAKREGDPILALIRASSINQDGPSSGLTVPNGEAQETLIRSVLAKGKLKGSDIDYVEAHGTGTSLGDPIEVRAIGATYGLRDGAHPLILGSVKTNFGHLEGASGIAGVIKTVLALQHETLPPHLNFKKLNPHIVMNFPAEISTKNRPWLRGEHVRRAAVSSFGFSGTNAHLIIEEAPLFEPKMTEIPERSLHLLTLSAKTEASLGALVERYLGFLNQTTASLADICYTANTGRNHQSYRIAVIAKDLNELKTKLSKGEFDKGEVQESKPYEIPFTKDLPQLLQDLAHAYVKGAAIDWKKLDRGYIRQKVQLPTYPFERKRYWADGAYPSSGRKLAIPSKYFELVWEKQDLKSTETTSVNGEWLIFTGKTSLEDAFTTHIQADGGRYTLVEPGEGYQMINAHHYVCNPLHREDFSRLLEEAVGTNPLQGIAYFWGNDLDFTQDSDTLNQLDKNHSLICGGALHLVQSLLQFPERGKQIPPLWLITRGAQAISDQESVNLNEALLVGLQRTISQEYPSMIATLVDLSVENRNPAEDVGHLLHEISLNGEETQVAWRENNRFVPRLNLAKQHNEQGATIDPKANYLITGGMGGIGLSIVDALVEEGAKHLFVVSRRKPTDEVNKKIESLREKGIDVRCRSVDITDQKSVENLLLEIKREEFPLKGIIHAAGVVDNAILPNQNWEKFTKVLSPKVKGSWILHQKTQELNIVLDFFILFSSISSVLGIPGQSNYSSANFFLDALAHYRKQKGLAALSINWGPWKEAGMLANQDEIQSLFKRRLPGFHSLETEQGIEAFRHLMKSHETQIMAVPIDLSQLAHLSGHLKILFSLLAPPVEERRLLDTEMRQLLPTEQQDYLKKYLKEKVRHILGFSQTDEIADQRGFFDLGMDSLMMVELKNELQKDLGNRYHISETIAFDYPNLTALKDYYDELLQLTSREAPQTIQITTQVNEPIAILGLSCRYPAGAHDPESFWNALMEGRDGIIDIPKERWNIESYYSPDPDTPGKIATRKAGFVDHIDLFDAEFFGISPREAEYMDPQQRMVLETSWEALERAGIAPSSLNGSLSGVFVGVSSSEYNTEIIKDGSLEDISNYQASGGALNAVPGRVSYFLGLQGPCMAIDAACSSSLVAIHQACQSLRIGECHLALAGGVNALFSPEIMVALSRSHMLSPDGQCKTFDAQANGYARSEGCGIIVLKRLSDAQTNNDPIMAVIKGSAINQDGMSGGLTVPNGRAQEALMRRALEMAQVQAKDVHYVETHGTGTPLGDPIEVRSISEVYGKERQSDNALILGALKTNMGHTESAAGVAGVIKATLSLVNEMIPGNIHFGHINPKINLDKIPAIIPTHATAWPRGKARRYAAASSFGFTGIIGHLILEEAPLKIADVKENPLSLHLLTLSAKSPQALKEVAKNYIQFFKNNPSSSLGDITYTANTSRDHFPHRLYLIAENLQQCLEKLEQGIIASLTPLEIPKIAFLFEGGGHARGISKTFYEFHPVFQVSLNRCTHLIENEIKVNLFDLLFNKDDAAKTHYAELILFCLEYALTILWESWGIFPDFVLGDQGGEYVAAVSAGILSLEEACKLAVARWRINIHSANAMEDFISLADSITYNTPQRGFISSFTGEIVDSKGLNSHYWIEQLNSSHANKNVLLNLQKQHHPVFIEIGTSTTGIDQLEELDSIPLYRFPSLGKNSDWGTLLESLGELYLLGLPINWTEFHRPFSNRKMILPTYPFQRSRYWVEGIIPALDNIYKGMNKTEHPFLARKMSSTAFPGIIFESEVSSEWPDFIEHHKIYDRPVIAGAGYLSAVLGAAKLFLGKGPYEIENVEFTNPIVLAKDQKRTVQIIFGATEEDKKSFEVISRVADIDQEDEWMTHARGFLRVNAFSTLEKDKQSMKVIEDRCQLTYSADEVYNLARNDLKLDLGKHFRWIETLHVGENEILGKLRLPDGKNEEEGYVLYPGFIDSVFQTIIGDILRKNVKDRIVAIPFAVQHFYYEGQGEKPVWVHSTFQAEQNELFHANLTLFNAQGVPVARITDFVARQASQQALIKPKKEVASWLYKTVWKEEPLGVSNKALQGTWLILGANHELTEQLTKEINKKGCNCIQTFISDKFLKLSDRSYQINIQDKNDMEALLKAVLMKGPVAGIVHLWSVEEPKEASLEKIKRAQENGTKSLLFLLQALIEAKQQFLPPIWLVTTGIQPIGDSSLLLEQTPLIGLLKTVVLEYSDIICRHVDLESLLLPSQQALHVLNELEQNNGEDQIAYRQGIRYVPRLMSLQEANKLENKLPFPPSVGYKMDPQGCYLITGGLGGLGLKIAEWLTRKGAQHLVLVGRHAPHENGSETIQKFRDQGIQVEIAQLDVADAQSVHLLMQKFGSTWPKLKGIFHLAGILNDATLLEQNWDHFEKVFAPKVYGSFNLHQYAKDLDLFVLFSSMASTFGNAGQSNYAAANAFMDALSEYRNRQNLPAISVSWGPWAETGMAKDFLTRHVKGGVVGINTNDGIWALEVALRSQTAHITIANINWERYIKQWNTLPTWLKAFEMQKENTEDLALLLENTIPSERLQLVKSYVTTIVKNVLGLRASQSIDEKKGFFDMGLDSLMAVEIRNRLQAIIGKAAFIRTTAVFDYSNLNKLANYVAEILGIEIGKDQKIESTADDIILQNKETEIRNLSDDDLIKKLFEIGDSHE